jgi:hypothetical protein
LLQFSDCALRARGTVGLFHAAKQRLQSRLFVPDHPPARKYLGLLETRYPDDLGGASKTGIEIIAREQGHPIDPPSLKWSDLKYVIGIKEDRYAEEALQA